LVVDKQLLQEFHKMPWFNMRMPCDNVSVAEWKRQAIIILIAAILPVPCIPSMEPTGKELMLQQLVPELTKGTSTWPTGKEVHDKKVYFRYVWINATSQACIRRKG